MNRLLAAFGMIDGIFEQIEKNFKERRKVRSSSSRKSKRRF